MPPAQILMPSITLNILKGVLKQNGFRSEIFYWNLLLEPFFKHWDEKFGDENFEFARLLPFVYWKAKHYNDPLAIEKIKNVLARKTNESTLKKKKSISPELLFNLPEKTTTKIQDFISEEIAGFNNKDVILSGFTAKFYQWLPALLVAEETKKSNPHIKTIIGGFESKNSALELLRNFNCFDFAVWGEGEYPLVQISHMINKDSSDFNEIPGLVYRKKKQLVISEKKERQYFNLDHYPEPDYEDFYSLVRKDPANEKMLSYPVEGSRGCIWNKCKFCVLNKGYKYRERDVESIVKEIELAIEKYHIEYFQFMDNSIIGADKMRLECLLKKLSVSYIDCPDDFSLAAEIIPAGLNASFYKKLALAGFRMMQVGGESFADSLLKKMNKKNSFSDNLLAYKFCLKYGINPIGANIITGIPGETLKDIKTCIKNIPFLRFFVSNRQIQFMESRLALDKHSVFYREINENEKEKYTDHFFFNYLPHSLIAKMNRFDLFHFSKNKSPKQKELWDEFFKILQKYHRAKLSYKLYDYGNVIQFEELYNNIKTDAVVFDKPEQWQILVNANSQLLSFDEMMQLLKNKYKNTTPKKLKTMMNELKSHHLLYFDENYNKIIAVIDTDCLL